MISVFVKPRPGGRVRMPDRNFRPMKAEGEIVPRNDFYERLIITGDLVVTDPPKEMPAAAKPPAADAAPAVPEAT